MIRIARVAEELRNHRFIDENLDDVVQLHLVLWHAWVNINREMESVSQAEKRKRKVADLAKGDNRA